MKNSILLIGAMFLYTQISAQSYPPQAGEEGTTAIHKDSPVFKSWGTTCTVTRGLQQINGTTGNYATFGTEANGAGLANGTLVSLGDGGSAILTFASPITNGAGFDFAIFENGFISNSSGRAFLELAFVEVSSDGENFFRFPSHNEYPADFLDTTTDDPGGSGFGTMDARYIHNFAGKYIANYGTPFDLSEVPDNPLLDKTKITHVKLIDVVGTNIDGYRTYDSHGNVAIDPFPTPFPTSGFDLDAVGVINEYNIDLNTNDEKNVYNKINVFPNPAKDFIQLSIEKDKEIKIYSLNGELVKQGKTVNKKLNISELTVGIYLLKIEGEKQTVKIIKSK